METRTGTNLLVELGNGVLGTILERGHCEEMGFKILEKWSFVDMFG